MRTVQPVPVPTPHESRDLDKRLKREETESSKEGEMAPSRDCGYNIIVSWLSSLTNYLHGALLHHAYGQSEFPNHCT